MLSVGHEARLMIGSGVDGADAVDTRGQTTGHISGEDIIGSDIVETLEKGKSGGIQRFGGLERGQFLDHDVTVANDDSLVVDLLGGGVIVCGGGDKVSGLHVENLHLDGERLVFHNALVSILGEHKLAAGCLVEADDATHGSLIARAGCNLLAIGEGNAIGKRTEAEVDATQGKYVDGKAEEKTY